MTMKITQHRWQIGICLLLCLLLGTVIPATNAADVVEIYYWQPSNNGSRIDVMEQLIEQFEDENPNIDIIHNVDIPSTGPLFDDALELALREGEGPHIVTIFNGWIPNYAWRGMIIPLPEGSFDPQDIREDYYPIVQSSIYEGRYWALPTAVRSMALFYNIEHFDAVGLDYPNDDWTWDDFIAAVEVLNDAEDFIDTNEDIVGFDWVVSGWGHHWLREVLVPQFGGQSFVDLPNESVWGSDAACEAFTFALSTEARPTSAGEERAFYSDPAISVGAYFDAGLASMHIDGSFRISNIDTFEFGVARLPTVGEGGEERSFGSYWAHALTPRVLANNSASTLEEREATIRFLQFITSESAGELWFEFTSELPALRRTPLSFSSPAQAQQLTPFVASLDDAYATPFINEALQRDIIETAYNSVILDGADPCDALRDVDTEIQELIDDFVEDRERWELGTGFSTLGNQ
ncbi:MAG: extracellular solute-binding protein [Chloroflexota bacterium]